MKQYSASYLHESRRGLWDGAREALAPLSLPTRERILDVGAGSGAFTQLLAAESTADVIALDADQRLLREIRPGTVVVGDAIRLPIRRDTVDLAVCQALLVNLPDPLAAVRELARVSTDLVAAIEPDNADVTVESTVTAEVELASAAREAYIEGHGPDATLGANAADLFREAGLSDVRTSRHLRERTVEPPYEEHAVQETIRKVNAVRIQANRETFLSGEMTESEFNRLRSEWRRMGRTVARQMEDESYRRTERFPLYVTVGRVSGTEANSD